MTVLPLSFFDIFLWPVWRTGPGPDCSAHWPPRRTVMKPVSPDPPPWAPTAPHQSTSDCLPSTLFIMSRLAIRRKQVRGRLRSLSTRAGLSLPPSGETALGWGATCNLILDVPWLDGAHHSAEVICPNVPSVGFLLCLLLFPGIAPTPSLMHSTHICVMKMFVF